MLNELLSLREPILPFDVPWKTADATHEAHLARLLDALDGLDEVPPAAGDSLDALERAHVAALATCNDGLACVLEYESNEEPVVYLPAVVRPLWFLLSCAPLVGRDGGPTRRSLARCLLEAAALLGGDMRLGFMALVGGEVDVPEYYAVVYPRALARLASLVRWAVAELESMGAEDGFIPAHLVESAPRLAAARFERARRACWPSLESDWKLTNGLPADIRGVREAWVEIDAHIAALTDAIDAAEKGKVLMPDGMRPRPGELVFVPAKGVTVVLEHFFEHDVVAHWARPTRSDTWYPLASLAALSIDPPPFAGPVPFKVAFSAKRALEKRLFQIRSHGGVPSFVRLLRDELDSSSGLERHTGRAYVDEDRSRTALDPTTSCVQATQAESALMDYFKDLLVVCDPVLGRVAFERARRLATRAAEGTIAQRDDFYARMAYRVLATCAWAIGDDDEAAADLFVEIALTKTDEPDEATLVGLASLRRWVPITTVLDTASWRQHRAKLMKQAANEWDLGKDAEWARRNLRIAALIERLAAEKGLTEASAGEIRALLAEEQFDYASLLWLRILHGARGWTPREIALSSYFELSASGARYVRGVERMPPEALVDEVAALRERARLAG